MWWCLLLMVTTSMVSADTDEEALFFLDLPYSRVEVTSYDVSKPTSTVDDDAIRMCTFSIVGHKRDAKAVVTSCPRELQSKVGIEQWQYEFSSPLPSKTELLRVSYLFPTAVDQRSAVFISPSSEVLRLVLPDEVVPPPDCIEQCWFVMFGHSISLSGEPIEPPPTVFCDVDIRVDWFGEVTVHGVSGCTQAYAQEEAVKHALTRRSWCPRWVSGAPTEYSERHREEIVVQLPVSDDGIDPGSDIRLRDTLPLGPTP